MNTARKLEVVEDQPFETAAAVKFEPADNNRRVIAFLIDSIIAGVITKLVGFVIAVEAPGIKSLAESIAFFITAATFWSLIAVEFGATPGKKIMGLKVVRADQDLNITFGQMFLRETIGRFCSVLPIGLGYFWVAIDKKERTTFHDKIAKTRVINYR